MMCDVKNCNVSALMNSKLPDKGFISINLSKTRDQ